MRSRNLVLSSNKRAWKSDTPILFLGNWCFQNDKKKILSSLDAIVAEPYGLSKKDKDRDFIKAKEIEEKLLEQLTLVLNEYHSTNFEKRYWQILLGHWLRRYINVMLNRKNTLEQCLKKYNVSMVSLFTDDNYELATDNTISALWAFNDDQWNNVLYKKLFKYLDINIPINFIPRDDKSSFAFKGLKYPKTSYKKMLSYIKIIISKLLTIFSKKSDGFIIESFMGLKNELGLQLRLGQLPQIWRTESFELSKTYNSKHRNILRKNINIAFSDNSDEFIYDMLFQLMPICFIEGYQELNQSVMELKWPKNPRFIFTCNSFDTDELFKAWTAMKVINGSKYIVGQHGANYGTYSYMNPSVEEVTADSFLTWGWEDGLIQHKPMFITKKINLKEKEYDSHGRLLFIQDMLYHRADTWDRNAEHEIYFNQQKIFYNNLSIKPKESVTLRLHSSYILRNPNEKKLWLDHDKSVYVDSGNSPIEELIKKSRIVVFSYDSTGMLEILSKNIPVIAFWENQLDCIRESAKIYYESLHKAKIIHFSPESAAEQINDIWENIESWWESHEVQNARKLFCNNYAKRSNKPVNDLSKYLLEKI